MITLYLGRLFVISLIAGFILIWDFRFFGWINILPVILLFVGLFAAGHAPAIASLNRFSKYRYILFRLLGPAVLLFLVLDRICDTRPPIVKSARFLCLNRSNFLASSSVSLAISSSNGIEVDFPVRASAFTRIPAEGTLGRAVIGRGAFGVSYIQRVEFDGYTR